MQPSMRSKRAARVLVALLFVLGCVQPRPVRDISPEQLAALRAQPDRAGPSAFPTTPSRLEQAMCSPEPEILGARAAASGVMGAIILDLRLPGLDGVHRFKWKVSAAGGEGWNNSPRRELAAYRIQQWFLDEADYVVPTTVARCISSTRHEAIEPGVAPTFDGTDCVLGALSVWLEGVEVPDRQLDPERFQHDAAYARAIARYNLLTYLIDNRDTRPANQLATPPDAYPRVYSVDNGISFGELVHNPFRKHMNSIWVPALPEADIERLRRLEPRDFEALEVIAVVDLEGHGCRSGPSAGPLSGDEAERRRETGVLRSEGRLELGLRPDEIDRLRRRVADLLGWIASGAVPVF